MSLVCCLRRKVSLPWGPASAQACPPRSVWTVLVRLGEGGLLCKGRVPSGPRQAPGRVSVSTLRCLFGQVEHGVSHETWNFQGSRRFYDRIRVKTTVRSYFLNNAAFCGPLRPRLPLVGLFWIQLWLGKEPGLCPPAGQGGRLAHAPVAAQQQWLLIVWVPVKDAARGAQSSTCFNLEDAR